MRMLIFEDAMIESLTWGWEKGKGKGKGKGKDIQQRSEVARVCSLFGVVRSMSAGKDDEVCKAFLANDDIQAQVAASVKVSEATGDFDAIFYAGVCSPYIHACGTRDA